MNPEAWIPAGSRWDHSRQVLVVILRSQGIFDTMRASLLFSTLALLSRHALAQQLAVSEDGTCGGTNRFTCLGSEDGSCCSSQGWCGQEFSHCGPGCQSAFGQCGTRYIVSTTEELELPPMTSSTSLSPDEPISSLPFLTTTPAQSGTGGTLRITITEIVRSAIVRTTTSTLFDCKNSETVTLTEYTLQPLPIRTTILTTVTQTSTQIAVQTTTTLASATTTATIPVTTTITETATATATAQFNTTLPVTTTLTETTTAIVHTTIPTTIPTTSTTILTIPLTTTTTALAYTTATIPVTTTSFASTTTTLTSYAIVFATVFTTVHVTSTATVYTTSTATLTTTLTTTNVIDTTLTATAVIFTTATALATVDVTRYASATVTEKKTVVQTEKRTTTGTSLVVFSVTVTVTSTVEKGGERETVTVTQTAGAAWETVSSGGFRIG